MPLDTSEGSFRYIIMRQWYGRYTDSPTKTLFIMYGPTETTVYATRHQIISATDIIHFFFSRAHEKKGSEEGTSSASMHRDFIIDFQIQPERENASREFLR